MNVKAEPISTTPPHSELLEWASQHFPFHASSLTSDHAWAATYRLQSKNETAWLKALPAESDVSPVALEMISETFSRNVPRLLSYDSSRRLMLFADHGGTEPESGLTFAQQQQLLVTYANIQAVAQRTPTVRDALPEEDLTTIYDRFLDLLTLAKNGVQDPEFPGNPFDYFHRHEIREFSEVFETAAAVLKPFLSLAQELPTTICHGDLRSANLAFLDDGEICLFDWDEAVIGPPGLSLHAQFSGCCATWHALNDSAEDSESDGDEHDRRLHESYIDTLVAQGDYDQQQLVTALPSAVLAGVLRYIISFAKYPVASKSTRSAIASNVWGRLSDVMDLAQELALESDEEEVIKLAYAMHTNGRSERAMELYEDSGLKPRFPCEIASAIDAAAPPEVFPALELTMDEQRSGQLGRQNRDIGVELFKRYGGLLLKNAFPVDLVEQCHHRFHEDSEDYRKAIREGGALEVGDRRFMISLKFDGPFANPQVFSNPLVSPILRKLLGDDAILGSYTAVASLPGSETQRMHRDNPPLFEENKNFKVPHFSIAMIVPLIPLNEETGATRIIKGTHRPGYGDEDEILPHQDPTVDLGSCYLMDCRLYHQGMANKSDRVRPIMSLVFQRSWYRDPVNFNQQKPLLITPETAASLPENSRRFVNWAL